MRATTPKELGGGAEPFWSWTARPAPRFWPTAGGRGKFRRWTSSSQSVGGGGGGEELFGSWTSSTEILAHRWWSGKVSVLDVQLPKGWGGGGKLFGSWTSSTEILAHRWRSGKISVLDVQLPKGWGEGGGGANSLGAGRPAPSGKVYTAGLSAAPKVFWGGGH